MAPTFVLFVVIMTNTGVGTGITSQVIPMIGQEACMREAKKLENAPTTLIVSAHCIQTN